MALVFLSYTHKDKSMAVRVQTAIEQSGHQVWRDDSRLRIGSPIPEGVAKGMVLCDYFALVITENALESSWMRSELNLYAADADKWNHILPLKCGEVNPEQFSPLLRATKYEDLSTNFTDGIRNVVEQLGPPSEEAGKKLDDLRRLRFAIDLALRAGGVAMRFYNSSLQENQVLDDKKNASTRADKAAQNEVIARIKVHDFYSDDGLIAEENPFNDEGAVRPVGYTWVVDPLDGTSNFDNKLPFFCSAVGCLRDGQPYIGVVFDPVSNDVYYAMKGMPTEVWNVSRGEVVQVRCDRGCSTLRESIIGTHISGRSDVANRLLGQNFLFDISKEVRQLRALGSGLLALAYVATGRLQGFLQLGSYLWDQAAGVVLVESAGGVVTDLARHNRWTALTKDMLATSNESIKLMFSEFLMKRQSVGG